MCETSSIAKVLLLTLIVLAACFVSSEAAVPELCDGRDDDADGTTDENCVRDCERPRVFREQTVFERQQHEEEDVSAAHERFVAWTGRTFGIVWYKTEGLQPADFECVFLFQSYDPSAGAVA
ncbi:MAG: hypothetical protein JSV80_10580 [Acidobacteriota bacterium]|nr:MAG: hypothetical protein JSV80_10580 [Acidobacteriota bacterium]